MTKHNRVDKDPEQIEFDRQQEECTFKPVDMPGRDSTKSSKQKPKINLPMSHGGY
jgi:hypothetical protein